MSNLNLFEKHEHNDCNLKFKLTSNAVYENRNVYFFIFQCTMCNHLFMQNEQNEWVELNVK